MYSCLFQMGWTAVDHQNPNLRIVCNYEMCNYKTPRHLHDGLLKINKQINLNKIMYFSVHYILKGPSMRIAQLAVFLLTNKLILFTI